MTRITTPTTRKRLSGIVEPHVEQDSNQPNPLEGELDKATSLIFNLYTNLSETFDLVEDAGRILEEEVYDDIFRLGIIRVKLKEEIERILTWVTTHPPKSEESLLTPKQTV